MTAADLDALGYAVREAVYEGRARWELHEAVASAARARGLALAPADAWDLIRSQVPAPYPYT